MADEATEPLMFRTLCVPLPMADGVLALADLAVDGAHLAAEIGDLLMLLHTALAHPVPRATSRVSAKLISQAALQPLLARLGPLESELELRMLWILADAGVALEFETGREVSVKYPDRLCGDQWGVTRLDFYHRRARLALFCDSTEHHTSGEARARDNGVCSALLLRKITPLRFTTYQILNQPRLVGTIVLEHLGRLKGRLRDVRVRPDAA
jgi:hypothetical protein